jgi:hypothetical protein
MKLKSALVVLSVSASGVCWSLVVQALWALGRQEAR